MVCAESTHRCMNIVTAPLFPPVTLVSNLAPSLQRTKTQTVTLARVVGLDTHRPTLSHDRDLQRERLACLHLQDTALPRVP